MCTNLFELESDVTIDDKENNTIIAKSKYLWIWEGKATTFCAQMLENGDDLALLRFEVIENFDCKSNVIGEYAISSKNVRNGFRTVPIFDPQTGKCIEDSHLLACFEFCNTNS